jgi:hypothetical protein
MLLTLLAMGDAGLAPRRGNDSPACPRRPLALGTGGGGMPPSWEPVMAGSMFWWYADADMGASNCCWCPCCCCCSDRSGCGGASPGCGAFCCCWWRVERRLAPSCAEREGGRPLPRPDMSAKYAGLRKSSLVMEFDDGRDEQARQWLRRVRVRVTTSKELRLF